jgi:hypothetical protein
MRRHVDASRSLGAALTGTGQVVTMRLVASLVLAGSIGLAAAGAVAEAQAQPPDSQVPGNFSATLADGEFDDQAGKSVASFEATDPRISGTWTEASGLATSVAMEDGTGDVVTVWWDDITIENTAGSWVGHSEGFGHSHGFDGALFPDGETIFLVGQGAYEGMTATLLSPAGQDRDPGEMKGGLFDGVIFPSGWRPTSEPAVEPSA